MLCVTIFSCMNELLTFQPKAVSLDFDGTAVPNDPTGRPSEELVWRVRAVREMGIHVFGNTGRDFGDAVAIAEDLGMDLLVANGGGFAKDLQKGIVIWERTMNPYATQHLADYVGQFELKRIVADEAGSIENPKPGSLVRPKTLYTDGMSVDVFSSVYTEVQRFPELSATLYHLRKTRKPGLIIQHKEATKGHGLVAAAKYLGIPTSEIIAVDDDLNGLDHLQKAGFAVAMGHAPEELKEHAHHVTGTFANGGLYDFFDLLLTRSRVPAFS